MAWRDTDEAQAFIASGASRETSPEIMIAIAFFATSLQEAVETWEDGPDLTGVCTMLDIWENVTKNGLRDASEFCWGASGSHWFEGSAPKAPLTFIERVEAASDKPQLRAMQVALAAIDLVMSTSEKPDGSSLSDDDYGALSFAYDELQAAIGREGC